MKAHRNMRLSDALKLSEELGCIVKYKNGNGEVFIQHKEAGFHITISNHGVRPNVQVVLFSKLRKLEKMRVNKPTAHSGASNASIREGGASHRK